jgi:uncharacterized FlaG/YvyC family protein
MVHEKLGKGALFAQLFVLLLSFGLLVVGCSSANSQIGGEGITNAISTQSQNVDDSTPSQSDSDFEQNVVDVSDSVQSTSTKSEDEKTVELLEQLIADGSYETEVSYTYHSGVERMIVRVSVAQDIVTAISLEGINNHRTSEKYINAVNDALPSLVVGKKIDEISLPKQISGSSLTTAAVGKHFQDLINQY